MDPLLFFVNGKKVLEKNANPGMNLLTYIRNHLRLTGSKLGCGEGGCGACTVMVSKWDHCSNTVRHFAVNACLAPLVSVHECAVTTVEGIGSTRTKLHQIQERLAHFHGSQCGFCTPGIVMSMYALLRNKKTPTSRKIDTCLQGNLCRCTGYRPIISAFQTFSCDMGEKCCKISKNQLVSRESSSEGESAQWKPYDGSQEPIFPPELANLSKSRKQAMSLQFVGESVTWHQPASLEEMLDLKSRFPEAKIVVGNTEVGIEMNVKGNEYRHLISPANVREMLEMKVEKKGVVIGAASSLSNMEEFLQKVCEENSPEKTQVLTSILKTLHLFAGVQIRNVACIGGNIMTASPISDLNPILLVANTKLKFASKKSGFRVVIMDENFFTGYRKTKASSDEVLISIEVPLLDENDVMCAFKQSKRRDDDIAVVNAAMSVSFQPETRLVRKLSIAYGGMSHVVKTPRKTTTKCVKRPWDVALLEDVCRWLSDEMYLAHDAPGGMVQYRRTLAISFFFKFYHHTFATLVNRGVVDENNVKESRSIAGPLSAEDVSVIGEQTWQEVPNLQQSHDGVGRPLKHAAGLLHATGEAEYIDDIPQYRDELHMAPILSSKAHAKILSVVTKKALSSPGVVDYIDITDVQGNNIVFENEDVFADKQVTCIGHVIGAIVADTQDHALRAARLVQVSYEDILPKIITIEDAIEHNSYYDQIKIVKGDIAKGFQSCDHILDGEIRVGGQEHFYMETQACIAIPRNGEKEMEIWTSSQDPTNAQTMAAICLGVSRNRINIRTKRMGGGFGGKQIKFCKISNPAAVAAKKLGRPVRCVLTRQDDMQITGGRHPFLGRYKVGFSNDGHIIALQEKLYNNAGNTLDLSVPIMYKAMFQTENSYNVPHMEVSGYVCRTNIASNTAFRAFGTPQATIIAEDWINRIAEFLKIEPEKVRERNLLQDSDTLIYGAPATDLKIRQCWKECVQKSRFQERRRAVDEFNKANRWKKRGIACVPTKFSIGYEHKFLNQAGALVLVYTDGSVLLFHGGTEMGQGLHTKMLQGASRVLGIPIDYIHIMETSSTTVPNASATAGSVSSDVNGMAVKNACEKIMKRLAPFIADSKGLAWEDLIKKAYHERISLSATGFYKVPGGDFNWDTENGNVVGDWATYRTSGCAVTEVEIDVLTGHHIVLHTELVVDVGNSLNPAVDIGQIEGAFAQGMGLVTIEEPLHSPEGKLLTVGPGAYKIPSFANTPKVFKVHLLEDSENEFAIYASKAVGEPPLLLGISVLCAIKDAVKSSRFDSGLAGPFRLDTPATAERIRLACADKFTNLTEPKKEEIPNGGIGWSIRT